MYYTLSHLENEGDVKLVNLLLRIFMYHSCEVKVHFEITRECNKSEICILNALTNMK